MLLSLRVAESLGPPPSQHGDCVAACPAGSSVEFILRQTRAWGSFRPPQPWRMSPNVGGSFFFCTTPPDVRGHPHEAFLFLHEASLHVRRRFAASFRSVFLLIKREKEPSPPPLRGGVGH